MNLDIFNIFNKRENDVNNFMDELSNYLEKSNDIGIIERKKQETGVSNISEIKMLQRQNEIIKNYANGDNLFFISKKDEEKNNYIVFEFEDDKKHTIRLTEEELPQNIVINGIYRKNEENYVLDQNATETIQDKIQNMIEDVLVEQNDELAQYRQEGHLYLVREDENDRIHLLDITANPGYALEEVDFPEELKPEATEGTVFKYENGTYTFYDRK